jgi:hypothetical protein
MRRTRVAAMIGACAAVVTLSTPTLATATGSSQRVDGLCGTTETIFTPKGVHAQWDYESNLDTWGAKRISCSGAITIHTITVDGYADFDKDVTFNVAFHRNHDVGTNRRLGFVAAPQPADDEVICSFTDVPGTYSATGSTDQQWAIDLGSQGCTIDKSAGKGPWVALQAIVELPNYWLWATKPLADVPIEADWRDVTNFHHWDSCLTFSAPPVAPDIGINGLMQDCYYGGETGRRDFVMVLS